MASYQISQWYLTGNLSKWTNNLRHSQNDMERKRLQKKKPPLKCEMQHRILVRIATEMK